MEEKELVTLSKYATTHRISLHQVVKQVRSGELETVVKTEEGKEVTYILKRTAEKAEEEEPAAEVPQSGTDYKKAYEALLEEHTALKAKYETLKEGKPRHAAYTPRSKS